MGTPRRNAIDKGGYNDEENSCVCVRVSVDVRRPSEADGFGQAPLQYDGRRILKSGDVECRIDARRVGGTRNYLRFCPSVSKLSPSSRRTKTGPTHQTPTPTNNHPLLTQPTLRRLTLPLQHNRITLQPGRHVIPSTHNQFILAS